MALSHIVQRTGNVTKGGAAHFLERIAPPFGIYQVNLYQGGKPLCFIEIEQRLVWRIRRGTEESGCLLQLSTRAQGKRWSQELVYSYEEIAVRLEWIGFTADAARVGRTRLDCCMLNRSRVANRISQSISQSNRPKRSGVQRCVRSLSDGMFRLRPKRRGA